MLFSIENARHPSEHWRYPMNQRKNFEINVIGSAAGAAAGVWVGNKIGGTTGSIIGAIAAAVIGHLVETEIKKL